MANGNENMFVWSKVLWYEKPSQYIKLFLSHASKSNLLVKENQLVTVGGKPARSVTVNPFWWNLIQLILTNYCMNARIEYRVWKYVWHVRLSTIGRDIRIWGSFNFIEYEINVDICSMTYNSRLKPFFMATYRPWTSHVASGAFGATFCSHTASAILYRRLSIIAQHTGTV